MQKKQNEWFLTKNDYARTRSCWPVRLTGEAMRQTDNRGWLKRTYDCRGYLLQTDAHAAGEPAEFRLSF